MNPEEIIINNCMVLKENENCLVITDENYLKLARKIYDSAKKISHVELLEIPVGRANGEEPPEYCSEKMLNFSVIICITTKSLTHTEARKNATTNGSRIATMPGITDDIFQRAINVDYDRLHEVTNRVADILDKGNSVQIVTEKGTDLWLDISKRMAFGRNAGKYENAGDFGNLPSGEAFIAPVEGRARGVFVVDESFGGVGKLEEPVKIKVKDGFAKEIRGKKEAEALNSLLGKVEDNNAYNIAELGIGTNDKAIVTGITLEDEKVLGTCHIALGKSTGFGGNVNVPIHLDGVISSPDIYVDGKLIMKKGELLR